MLKLGPDLLAQVEREVSLRRGQRLVLADQAAQLLGHCHHAGFECGVGVERHGFLRVRKKGTRREQHGKHKAAHGLTH